MRTRWLIPVVAVLMVLVGVAPMAAAGVDCDKLPNHPQCGGEDPPDEEIVDVTMVLANGHGLTTDCDDGDGIVGSIEMLKTPGSLEPTSDPILGVYMDVAWERIYPDPIYGSDGSVFTGCHRMTLDPDQEAILGALMIELDDSGAVADILWHFDYWYVWGERGPAKKPRPYLESYEQFTLSMDETTLVWVDDTPDVYGDTYGTLTAEFWMLYHLGGEGYEPIGSQVMSFTVHAVPRS
jgi:hypothetical protein